MHDIGRTQLESEYEGEHFEFGNEGEFYHGEGESPFHEAEEAELAAELLATTSEAELDHFLGSLLKKAGQAVGGFIKSPVGQALGGQLKGLAKKALPMVGRAIGSYAGGSRGGDIGGQIGTLAGKIFGLELEGYSHEDREFEVAKRFVRLACTAAKNAAASPGGASPQMVAQQALSAAAQHHAPGLLQGGQSSQGGQSGAVYGSHPGKHTGRWIRRGRVIVVLGV